MQNTHDLPARLGRRDWLKGCAAGALCLGGSASFAQNPGAYSVVLLGDTPDGLGRRTLEAYAADPRRAFATHARLVLGRDNR